MPENHGLSRSFVEGDIQPTSDADDGILSKVVENPSEFISLKEPGSLQVEDLGPDKELFVFMIPDKTINPLSLVNAEVVVGGRKGHALFIKEQQCKMVSYKSFSAADTPSLFLPDEMGELHQVNSQIKGHVIIKGQPRILPSDSKIDIDALRSVQHKPPVDIKERNFLSNAGTRKSGASSPKKRAAVKELDETSLKILKKKKKKDTSLNYDNNDQAENGHAVSLDASVVIKKKEKKSQKKVKSESLDHSVDTLHYDLTLDPPKKKKSKKLKLNVTL